MVLGRTEEVTQSYCKDGGWFWKELINRPLKIKHKKKMNWPAQGPKTGIKIIVRR